MVLGLIISCLVWLTSITSPDYYGLLFNLKIFYYFVCAMLTAESFMYQIVYGGYWWHVSW